jgi:hypothetical protein
MAQQYFRDSGFENIALVATVTGAATGIASPGAGNSIYLLGVHAHANTLLRENDASGNIILAVAAGNANLPSTVKVASNTAVYNTATNNTSIFYYIDSTNN